MIQLLSFVKYFKWKKDTFFHRLSYSSYLLFNRQKWKEKKNWERRKDIRIP